MPRTEVLHLHPEGWETDPEDEYHRLSTLDYCVGQVYTNYALFLKLTDAEKKPLIPILRRGLEITLSQCRALCGTIDTHPDNGAFCFHKKRDSTVEFHVQWLDSDSDSDKSYPSFAELEKQHFTSQSLGDINTWCVAPMTYGEKPEAQPQNKPRLSAFKATFIRGGLVFMMHHHHYANDIMGWAGELHQLAENCAAVFRPPEDHRHFLPPWDQACLDRSRVTAPDLPEDQRVDGPVPPLRHPDHRRCQWLLFHLPKSKAIELKRLATPPPASSITAMGRGNSHWISTYDASMSLIWRHLTRHRVKLFPHHQPTDPLIWGEAVDMRRRLSEPSVPERTQGNVVFVALSSSYTPPSPLSQSSSLSSQREEKEEFPRGGNEVPPPLTVGQVTSPESDFPLWKIAQYIRSLTNSVTQEKLEGALHQLAPIRDKTGLFLRTDSFPPLSNFTTDWRDTKVAEADFGFGRPTRMRFPFDEVTPGLCVVYPPGSSSSAREVGKGGEGAEDDDDDEGCEFCIGFEEELREELLADREWSKFFEFRGVDAEEKGNTGQAEK